MPGERTLYRKIQVVLDYAKEGKHHNEDSLLDYIQSQHPTNFIYYWRDRKTDETVHGYSVKSIAHVIRLCVELKLLSREELLLTETGVSAADPRRFPNILGEKVKELFEEKGISLASIHAAIARILQAESPTPPTAEKIWEYARTSNVNIDLTTFNQMIALLGQCKILLMTQRRIYLPFPL